MIICKSEAEIERMKEAGAIVASCLRFAQRNMTVGLTTAEIDQHIEKIIRSGGAKPAFKGYRGYPASACISVNEQVVHGIPGKRRLRAGDIVGIDVGAELRGYFGDAAATFAIGSLSSEGNTLLQVTRSALYAGIEAARIGNRLGDVSNAIQRTGEGHGFSVVREFVGHGIGRSMHEEPQVPNFGDRGRGPVLEEGMVLALEPMLNMGTYEVKVLRDGWTVVTADGKPSAHFEHTVAITANGPRILTEWEDVN